MSNDTRLLQHNTRQNLLRTLADLSDEGRQQRYKQAVPFVQVPVELLAQWDEYARLLKTKQAWFLESLTATEQSALWALDALAEPLFALENLPDVPEIFALPEWQGLMQEARSALHVFQPSVGG